MEPVRNFVTIGNGIRIDTSYQFAAYSDLKVRWDKEPDNEPNKIDFFINDYLRDAPKEVIDDMIRELVRVIFIGPGSPGRSGMVYPESLLEYLASHDFLKRSQSAFLRRQRLSEDFVDGIYHNLRDVVNRLTSLKMVKMNPNLKVLWSSGLDKAAKSFPRWKMILVSSDLDLIDIPENVLECVVYNQMHIVEGVDRYEPYPLKESAELWYFNNRKILPDANEVIC